MDNTPAHRIASALEALNLSVERSVEAIHRLADQAAPGTDVEVDSPVLPIEGPSHEELTFGAIDGTSAGNVVDIKTPEGHGFSWAFGRLEEGKEVCRAAWDPLERLKPSVINDRGAINVGDVPGGFESMTANDWQIFDKVLLFKPGLGYRVDVLKWTKDWRRAVPLSRQEAELTTYLSPGWKIATLDGLIPNEGSCPVDEDVEVEYRMRSSRGRISSSVPAGSLRWSLGMGAGDIMEYRLEPQEEVLIACSAGYFLAPGDGTTDRVEDAYVYTRSGAEDHIEVMGSTRTALADLEGWVENDAGRCIFDPWLDVEVEFASGKRHDALSQYFRWALRGDPGDIARYRLN